VLVALAQGEPEAALPEALRAEGIEPLAADFRREGDGKRLAFLKIVAGVAGIPLDALVQRDAQRQVRRVTAITLGAGLLALVMAGLLVMALQARSEAERRRAGAEGLVRFMLTTLRQRLREVGRLETMQEANQRALRYFSEQGDPALLPDDSVEVRALVFHALGEDDITAGRLPEARARFDEAYRATRAVLGRRPNDPDSIFAHAQSVYWLGREAQARNDLREAEARWQEYLAQAQALERVETNSRRALMELGYATGNLCQLALSARTNLPATVARCRASVGFERAALTARRAEGDPPDAELRVALANRLGWLADALNESKIYPEALALRREELRIVSAELARNPKDAELRERVIAPSIGMGKIAIARGSVGEGIGLLEASLGDLEHLHAAAPDNQGLLLQRVRVTLLIADALLRTEQRGLSAHYCDRAEALLRESVAQGQSREALSRLYKFLAAIRERGKT
jgi:hypothetical protein